MEEIHLETWLPSPSGLSFLTLSRSFGAFTLFWRLHSLLAPSVPGDFIKCASPGAFTTSRRQLYHYVLPNFGTFLASCFRFWRLPSLAPSLLYLAPSYRTLHYLLDTLAACEILITENLHSQWFHTNSNLTFSPATDLMFGLVEIFKKCLVNNRMVMNVYVYFFFFSMSRSSLWYIKKNGPMVLYQTM